LFAKREQIWLNKNEGVKKMATYIMLSNVTSRGAKTIKTKPERIREVNHEVERIGGKVIQQYALLGPYDFLTILEAPDSKTIAKISLEIGARGSVKILTLAAIPIDSFIANLK
jgi:uncharacterized protein with GYD domain